VLFKLCFSSLSSLNILEQSLQDICIFIRQHAALPEGARHINLLTEVVHLLLEQFELIHVELLLLFACSLGSHAPAHRVAVIVFIFNSQFFSGHGIYRDRSSW
jgi:hypothetical protein